MNNQDARQKSPPSTTHQANFAKNRLDTQFLEGHRARSRRTQRTWESIKQIMAPGLSIPSPNE